MDRAFYVAQMDGLPAGEDCLYFCEDGERDGFR